MAVDLARVAAVIGRIAADVDELARARQAQDLNTAAVRPRPAGGTPPAADRAGPAVPGLLHPPAAAASSTPQLARASDAWQAGRYRRGEIDQRPGYTGNPFRPR